jgi:hypothetical protein
MHQSMHISARLLSSAGIAMLVAACSSDSTGRGTTTPPGNEGTATQTYTRIIEGSWTLAPGTEKSNLCVKKDITEDMYISAIRPIHPPGSHHTLLTIGDASDDCRSSVPGGFVYAAGVGSQGLQLPKGVALKLPAGKTLDLSLHIYNTSNTELTGTSGMEVVTMNPEDVEYESDSVLAGPLTFTLPPNQVSTISNECQLTADQSAYALFPHMHQLGTHLKTTVTSGGVANVLHDAAYQFNEQLQLPLDPILQLHAGDTVKTECTYSNTTSKEVTFGESSDTEMCFSVLFRYPKQGSGVCGGAANPIGTTN